MTRQWRDPTVLAVAAITLAGLLLRCGAAQGALWLDEAWSAVFARNVATPAGVFLNINHDNNHHLNTLWLQLVGGDAAPIAQRALSIIAGAALVPLMAAVAGRRGSASAILGAIAFAFSPYLVTYGAEARGYAPMLFAFGCAINVIDRWLAAPTSAAPTTALALAALLGCMAQGTMVFALSSLTLWVLVVRSRSVGLRAAIIESTRLFAPATVAALAFVALVWFAAHADPAGFQFGNREAHDWARWAAGLDQLYGWTLGTSFMVVLLTLMGGIVRDRIGVLAVIAGGLLPLAVAALYLPNSGASRYYIVALPPVLLWMAIALPRAWSKGGAWRMAAVVVATVFTTAAMVRTVELVGNLRGDPGLAIREIEARQPKGAIIAVEHSRSTAILLTAARSTGYPLGVTTAPCPAARFRFVERDGTAPFPAQPNACGRSYREIARGDPTGLSGSHWRLYAAQ